MLIEPTMRFIRTGNIKAVFHKHIWAFIYWVVEKERHGYPNE